jgi:serine/threonine-protein kinase
MSDSHADRNLLFGILALQMDFIERDALVAAMNAWVLEKSKPIGQILVTQGKLGHDEHALLDALVKKHLERHSNDPQQSLAAVSSVGSVKQELENLADPDLGQSLKHVTAAHPQDPYATAMISVGSETSLGQRFRILRPHARGGLGQVSVAHDAELHREVALKEIQPRHAGDSQSRTRFLVEAEITGGLEHPGIVPVYGLGTYDDGRPFYAMRFIRGDSLKEAIDRFHRDKANRDAGEVSVELRQMLGRLIDVCNAIEYAHCRGVLHRDLKPGNIMLGKYGETLVVDWGLAKPLDQPESVAVRLTGEASLKPTSASGTAPTLLGSAVGTPQYMSPEQAAGRHDHTGPASDVYSLGATMYTLLTGRAAFEQSDVGAVLQRVQRGDFPRPRSIDKTVSPALEAVCLKAMALEPQDRYSSPLAMANDLEHWLADEPVSAYQDSAVERASRWVRRHRSWAIAGAAALVLVSAVSIGATVMINEARRQEVTARRQEEDARKEAQRQQELAEQSFQQARRAVDDFFTRVAENDLLDVPGLQPLRRELLDVALRYDQEFIKSRGEDPALRRELASAWFRLGMITSEIESHVKSLGMFEKARTIQEELLKNLPGDTELRLAASNTQNEIGRLMLLSARPDDALKAFQLALAMREKLAGEKPDQEEYERKVASSLMNVATVRKHQGQAAEALADLERANSIRQKLLGRNPQSPLLRRDAARGSYNLGLMQQDAGRFDDAQASLQRASQLYRSLAEQHPLVIEYRQALARTLRQLGLLQDKSEPSAATASLREAVEVQQRLATENPQVGQLAADLAAICSDLAQFERRGGNTAEARRYIQRATENLQALTTQNPTVVSYASDLAAVELIHAELLLDNDEPTSAAPLIQQARGRYEVLRQAQPGIPQFAAGLATSWGQTALVQRRSGDLDEARASYQRAAKLFEQLTQSQPADARAHDGLARCFANLGMIDQSQEHPADALGWFEKARAIHERFSADSSPARWSHLEHLAETMTLVGSVQLGLKKSAEAAAAFDKAQSLATELAKVFPSNDRFKSLLEKAQAGKAALTKTE